MREKIKIKLLQNILKEVTQKYDDFIQEQQDMLDLTFEKAIRDPLTRLYNRQYFFDFLKKAVEKIKRLHEKGFIVFLDLDNFKNVNDTLGHEKGDIVLKDFARILTEHFRGYDIIARYGGDEFMIYVENRDKDTINKRLKQLETIVDNHFKTLGISVSYGISCFPDDSMEIKDLINIADNEMYKYKKAKKANR